MTFTWISSSANGCGLAFNLLNKGVGKCFFDWIRQVPGLRESKSPSKTAFSAFHPSWKNSWDASIGIFWGKPAAFIFRKLRWFQYGSILSENFPSSALELLFVNKYSQTLHSLPCYTWRGNNFSLPSPYAKGIWTRVSSVWLNFLRGLQSPLPQPWQRPLKY